MQPAGYSKRPLAAKLGLEPGMRAYLVDTPPGFVESLGEAATQLTMLEALEDGLAYIQIFATQRAALEAALPLLAAALAPNGMLWICWPKLASNLPTDLRDNAVRETGLAVGLVDVKVAAIDTVWSGLKFVRRLRDR